MKDRSTEVVNSHFEDTKEEREKFERNALKKENPLSILDRLRASLKALLNFKQDFENELKDQKRRKKSEAEETVIKLKKQMESLEQMKNEYERNAFEAIHQKNQALNAKKDIIEESNSIILKMKNDNLTLKELLTQKEEELDRLNKMLDKRDEILRHREIQLMKVEQLKREIQRNNLKHHYDLNKIRAEQYKTNEKFQSELAYFNKVKAEQKEAEEKLRKLDMDLRSYKLDASRQTLQTMKHEVDARQTEVERMRLEVEQSILIKKQMEDEIRTTKREYYEYKLKTEKTVKDLQKQVDYLKEQLLEAKTVVDKQANQPNTLTNDNSTEHLLQYYKKKYKEKEKEASELTKRVRRMVLMEHRESLSQKIYEMERRKMPQLNDEEADELQHNFDDDIILDDLEQPLYYDKIMESLNQHHEATSYSSSQILRPFDTSNTISRPKTAANLNPARSQSALSIDPIVSNNSKKRPLSASKASTHAQQTRAGNLRSTIVVGSLV